MKRVRIYILWAFGLAWVVWIGGRLIGVPTSMIIAVSSLVMWFPALATLISRNTTKDDRLIYASFKPLIKRYWRVYLIAWFSPTLVALLGAVFYFICYPQFYDPGYTAFTQALGTTEVNPQILLLVQIFSAMIFAPLINMFFALGEEIGWRGLLFPSLKKRFGLVKAHLFTGIIWGLWHTPINMLGYNYGLDYPNYPYGGVVAMCFFCIAIGIFLSGWTERSGSIWPAALGHGAINAVAGVPSLFLIQGEGYLQIMGPAMNGFVAGLPLYLIATGTLLYYQYKEKQRLTLVPPITSIPTAEKKSELKSDK